MTCLLPRLSGRIQVRAPLLPARPWQSNSLPAYVNVQRNRPRYELPAIIHAHTLTTVCGAIGAVTGLSGKQWLSLWHVGNHLQARSAA